MINVLNVSFSYNGKKAVDDVSFEVREGDYVCVVGENGSGKTTLMKVILGLLKTQSGEITFDGIAPSEIGYLPQQAFVQKDFPASIWEVVLSGCLNAHRPVAFFGKKDKERAAENLERLGISDLKKKSYRDLSGGQQQRALLARALCATEKLIVLDEPAAGLDPLMTVELYALLENLNKSGLTIIMISHDIMSAVRYGNKVLQLATKPLFFGSTAEYIKTQVYAKMTASAHREKPKGAAYD